MDETNQTEIKIGYRIAKPVITQEECDVYSAMVDALNEHNNSVKPGEDLWTIEDKEDCYEIVSAGQVPSEEESIAIFKDYKVTESKTALSEYLAEHPLQWTDGKYYSVTSEKQSLLTSNLALYQISAAAGTPFKLTWNSTGDECVEWAYEDLAALALTIGTYVKPFVSHQQKLELMIRAATTQAELDAIEISYDETLAQALSAAGIAAIADEGTAEKEVV